MYKVFLNDSSLSMLSEQSRTTSDCERFEGKQKLFELLDEVQKKEDEIHLKLLCPDPEKQWQQLMSHYELIEAAGGVVLNENDEIMMILRNGKWDLPKGKLEKGEEVREGALREVEEECGKMDLFIQRELPVTYHTYILKGQRILKRTYWFEMKGTSAAKLIPQKEEGIEDVLWVDRNRIEHYLKNTYSSIRWLLQNFLS